MDFILLLKIKIYNFVLFFAHFLIFYNIAPCLLADKQKMSFVTQIKKTCWHDTLGFHCNNCYAERKSTKPIIKLLYEHLQIFPFQGDKLIYRIIRDYLVFYQDCKMTIDSYERMTLPSQLRLKTRKRLNKKQRQNKNNKKNNYILFHYFNCNICNALIYNEKGQIYVTTTCDNCTFCEIASGDSCSWNRNPTLHRASLQGLHFNFFLSFVNIPLLNIPPVNTLTMNADFDGDEINF